MSIKDRFPNSEERYRLSQSIGEVLTSKSVVIGVLVILALYFTFPVYWTFVSSLKTLSGIHQFPPNLIPTQFIDPIWQNYANLWNQRSFNLFTRNSLIVAISTTAVVVTFGTLAGYGFSRFRFPYDDYVFIGILGARLLPPVGMLVPFYRLFANLGLIDTQIALVTMYTYMNLPLVIWLMRNYFVSIPADLDQAAYIDGATRFQTFKDIILPLAKPGIAASAILTFLFSWREFLLAFAMTFTTAAKTIPVGAMMMLEDVVILWNYLAAAGFIAMVPALIFVMVFQRYIVSGLTAGAIKG